MLVRAISVADSAFTTCIQWGLIGHPADTLADVVVTEIQFTVSKKIEGPVRTALLILLEIARLSGR